VRGIEGEVGGQTGAGAVRAAGGEGSEGAAGSVGGVRETGLYPPLAGMLRDPQARHEDALLRISPLAGMLRDRNDQKSVYLLLNFWFNFLGFGKGAPGDEGNGRAKGNSARDEERRSDPGGDGLEEAGEGSLKFRGELNLTELVQAEIDQTGSVDELDQGSQGENDEGRDDQCSAQPLQADAPGGISDEGAEEPEEEGQQGNDYSGEGEHIGQGHAREKGSPEEDALQRQVHRGFHCIFIRQGLNHLGEGGSDIVLIKCLNGDTGGTADFNIFLRWLLPRGADGDAL